MPKTVRELTQVFNLVCEERDTDPDGYRFWSGIEPPMGFHDLTCLELERIRIGVVEEGEESGWVP